MYFEVLPIYMILTMTIYAMVQNRVAFYQSRPLQVKSIFLCIDMYSCVKCENKSSLFLIWTFFFFCIIICVLRMQFLLLHLNCTSHLAANWDKNYTLTLLHPLILSLISLSECSAVEYHSFETKNGSNIRVMLLFTSSIIFLLPFLGLVSSNCSVSSSLPKADADDGRSYSDPCMKALEDQVRVEFEASLQYILMAAHFDQVTFYS